MTLYVACEEPVSTAMPVSPLMGDSTSNTKAMLSANGGERTMNTLRAVILITPFMIACVPTQNVRPLPDFVGTAIEPGDKVKVVTRDGTKLDFTVSEVRTDALCSGETTVLLSDIDQLALRSRERPAYPCGGEKPLGCSVPQWIRSVEKVGDAASLAFGSGIFFRWHSTFEETFYDACIQHDFCYRHGYRTYGHIKGFCDEEFYANMKAVCLAIDVLCLSAAREFYIAVSRYSETAYQNETSTHCAYDGPPAQAAQQSEVNMETAISPRGQPSLMELLRRVRPRQADLLTGIFRKREPDA